jgi:hypothetical protein
VKSKVKWFNRASSCEDFEELERGLLISIISPNKFKEGGAAILQETNKNQKKERLGTRLIMPLLR